MQLQDANGVTCFTDAGGISCWTDADGNTLCCSGSQIPGGADIIIEVVTDDGHHPHGHSRRH